MVVLLTLCLYGRRILQTPNGMTTSKHNILNEKKIFPNFPSDIREMRTIFMQKLRHEGLIVEEVDNGGKPNMIF